MNDEIKEILDDLDYCKNRKRGNISLKHNECDLLLDYITNLQQNYNDNVTKYEELLEKYFNTQQRIDKAIQYIEEKGRLKYNPDELINILRGDSNETV